MSESTPRASNLEDLVSVFQKAIEAEHSTKLLLSFFEYASLPSWIKILQGSKLYMYRVNRAFERQIGLTAEECVGRKDDEIWPVGSQLQGSDTDKHVIETRSAVETQTISIIGGETTHFRVRKWPILNSVGVVIAICGQAERIS